MNASGSRLFVLAIAAAPALALLGLGCQRTYRPEYAPAVTHPVQYDEALARRDWGRSTAYYLNGDVVAGPTNSNTEWALGDRSQSTYARRQRMAIVTEPLIALGNIAAMPVSIVMDPPTEQRRYEGTVVGPSYTLAAPPSELQRETELGRRRLRRAEALRQREAPGERSLPGAEPGERSLPGEAPGERRLPAEQNDTRAPAGAEQPGGAGGTGGGGGGADGGGGGRG